MLLLVNFLISGLNLQGSGGGGSRENPHQQRETQGHKVRSGA